MIPEWGRTNEFTKIFGEFDWEERHHRVEA